MACNHRFMIFTWALMLLRLIKAVFSMFANFVTAEKTRCSFVLKNSIQQSITRFYIYVIQTMGATRARLLAWFRVQYFYL